VVAIISIGSIGMGVDTLPSHLPLVYTLSLFAVLLLERVSHALVWLCVSMVAHPTQADQSTMASEARGVLSGLMCLLLDSMRVWVAALAGLAQWCIYYIPMVLIFFFFVWVMSVFVSTQSVLLRDLLFTWNNGGSAMLRGAFVVPLQLLNMLFQAMVPLWNAWVYFWKGVLNGVIVPVLQDNMEYVLKAMTAATGVIQGISYSIVSFAESLRICTDTACLSVGSRVFDVLTPMIHFRLLVSYVLMFLRSSCAVMTPVFDVLAYPLLDSNFAQALHAGLNSPLYAVVHLPLVTYSRCAQAVNDTDGRMRSLACTPDVSPVFNLAAASARYGGILVDNWMDITWITILSVFGLAPETCAESPIHFNYIAEQTLFGGNETRVVGLGGSSYALTDGNSVQYTFYRGVTEQVFSRDHWPFKIEPALGIAAIEYDSAEAVDDSGSRTLSMLGCVCQDVVDESVDQGTRMQIHCSVARYQSEDADEALDTSGLHVPVSFALPSTEGYLKCARAKIVVDSVRWPLSRLSVPGTLASGGRNWYNPLDELASSDGTDGPVEIDAAIWVVPACGAEGVFDPVCARSFEKAACFPYCLAVRAKGSASRGMVLYNADDWTENVQLQNRDCGISQLQSTGLTSNTKYSDPSDIPKNYRAIMTDLLDILDKRVVVVDSETPATYDPVTMMCVSSETVSSRMNRSAVAGIDSRYEAILMEGQPFAVTGGVALIPVDNSDGTVGVRVQRLYGDEGTDVFTMVTTHANLPAIKPCETPSGCDKLPRDDLVSIPYPWYAAPARHNPAVETRWGVFYAVNPSMDMFSEFAKMCQNRTDYKLQIEALSSYGGIRIWRVDAFAFTTPDSSTGSTGSSIEFPDVFSKDSGSLAVCGNPFNVLVTSMEYLNADNVAIQVMHAAPAYLNTSTMAPLGNDPQKVTYRTYFLHPVTMQLNETHMWQADSAIAQLSSGGSALCPGLRQMPQFGSMAAEMAASVILATRMMVN
jgi:hypothetical protein